MAPAVPAPYDAVPGSAEVTSSASGGTGGGASAPAAAPGEDSARIVRTASIDLQVADGKVGATVQRLQALVAAVPSAYVSDSTSDEAGEHPSASMTVRMPVASFATLLEQVRRLRVKVVSASQSGKDVTATYADTQAQIQSLKAARSRYLDILARARTISEILSVQQRVDDVQQQIDRLEGQRRVLADQSDYGTLTVSVAEEGADRALAAQPRSGWSKAWYDAHHGFTHGLQRILAGSGVTLLVLLVAVVLLLVGRSGWRVVRRRLL
jgi:flagellar biosynthesis chaperone FliJ